MTAHKHYAIIIQWAANPNIKLQYKVCGEWNDLGDSAKTIAPTFNPNVEWRIKPEPKPDIVYLRQVHHADDVLFFSKSAPNISITFDGETGKLKHVEII